MAKLSLIWILALLSLACSEKQEVVEKHTSPTKLTNQLQPGDEINISIKGIPFAEQKSITGVYVVPPAYLLRMPFLKKQINLRGMSCHELEKAIERNYIENLIYRTPRVTIHKISKKTIGPPPKNKQYITISGNVPKQGPIKWTVPGSTLEQALAKAGMTTQKPHQRIILIRNGRKYLYSLNSKNHRQLKLYPNDQIIIKQRSKY